MKKIILIYVFAVAAAVLSGYSAFAQTRITGHVADSKGEPVIGAAVMLQGSASTGAVTDINGNYTLVLPSAAKDPKLNVSCIGYTDQLVEVAGRSVIDFVIKEDNLLLDEVVVVGYGSMRKSDLTGSVTSVKIDGGEAAKVPSVSQLLQGHAAGVQVISNGGSPDSGVSIRVRGMSSLNGSNEPLYVIDGIILNTQSSTTSSLFSQGLDNTDGNEATNGLMGLNPQDIESIEILKDASATAIYGALAANGVVLITTKKARSEKPVIKFSAGIDVSSRYKRMDVLSFDEYVDYVKYQYETNKLDNALSTLKNIYYDADSYSELKCTPVDWQDEVLRTSVSQRWYFSIAGNPGDLNYNFSFGYNNQNGIIKNTGTDQYTMRLNIDRKVGKKFSFGTKTNFAFVNSNLTSTTGSGRLTESSSLTRSMIAYKPFITNTEAEADLSDDDDEFAFKATPTTWIREDQYVNRRKEFRVTPNLYAEYKILPYLVFRSMLGADLRNSERYSFKSENINSDSSGNIAARSNVILFNWNWDNTLNFMNRYGDHNITATLGSSTYQESKNTQSIEGWNLDNWASGIAGLNDAANTASGYTESSSRTLSFFARGVYSFRDRYVLTATFRADGSSKFQGANKWAFFPSAAFAWRLSEEPWFKVNVISNAKIRLGWGRVGNQAISNYQTLTNYGSNKAPSANKLSNPDVSVGLAPSNLANPNLKWETTEQYNVGLDLSFWKGRLAFTADAYLKTTFDLLQKKDIPTSSGFSSIWMNEGVIQNRGLEFSLDATPVATKDFEWSLNGNISFNRNKLVSINSTASTYGIWVTPDTNQDVVYYLGSNGASSYCKMPVNIFMEGYPMGLFYGFKVKGVVKEGETGTPLTEGGAARTAGYLDYCDLNGNGYIDLDDRTVIGDPNPDFTYGFGTTLRYKRFSLNVMFNGSQGNDIFNLNLAKETDTSSANRNIMRNVWYDAWTPENQDTKYPGIGLFEAGDYEKVSDLYVEDGSYLRLSDIALSYNIPIKSQKAVVKGINLGLSARNLKIWTKYSGWDPDVNSFGSSTSKMGFDSGSYPSARTFSFDVRLTF